MHVLDPVLLFSPRFEGNRNQLEEDKQKHKRLTQNNNTTHINRQDHDDVKETEDRKRQ